MSVFWQKRDRNGNTITEYTRGVYDFPETAKQELLRQGVSGKGIGYMFGYRSGSKPATWKPTHIWLGGCRKPEPYLHEQYKTGFVLLGNDGVTNPTNRQLPLKCMRCGAENCRFAPVFSEFNRNAKTWLGEKDYLFFCFAVCVGKIIMRMRRIKMSVRNKKTNGQIVIAYNAPGDLILIIATLQERYREIIELPQKDYSAQWATMPEIEELILALMAHLLSWYAEKHRLRADRLFAIAAEAKRRGLNLDLSRWQEAPPATSQPLD